MFVLSKRNIILTSADGSQSLRIPRDYVGEIPEWAAKTPYVADLIQDGKLVVTTKSDKDTQKAAEKPVKVKRKSEE